MKPDDRISTHNMKNLVSLSSLQAIQKTNLWEWKTKELKIGKSRHHHIGTTIINHFMPGSISQGLINGVQAGTSMAQTNTLGYDLNYDD